jgi:hypothetical protein
MTATPGSNSSSKPAVYNENSTGASQGEQGVLQTVQSALESFKSWTQLLNGDQVSDTNLNAIQQQANLPEDTPLRMGRVVLAMPYVHCYKVQLTGRQGTCIASAVARTSHSPIGVKAGDVIPPNSPVLIWYPTTSSLAYILAVLPQPTVTEKFNASDYVQQGGNSGVKKVEAYRNIPKAMDAGAGWVPQSCGRPMDGTIGEYVRMSETGIGLLIDSFQTYLRVNESCGLWLNYFDNFTKLAGLTLQILSYCEHVFQQYDEGECFSLKGHITYPWEATGQYSYGTAFSRTNPPESVQLDRQFPFATEDLTDPSITPVYRLTEYAGYIGQGFNRTLMCPSKTTGARSLSTAVDDKDVGLFNEFISLDGSYGVRSAKQIVFAKYPLIPNPRRIRLAEDPKGDDLEKDNDYKFSGIFGEGDPHQVKDWDSEAVADVPNMLKPAGILDLATHLFNWKNTHPFHYHKKDYTYPEEGDNESELTSVKFYVGQSDRSYVDAEFKTLRIDERYGNVKYYNTASFFTMNDDGSVVIADGYGSQITMAGGQIRLEAGGDVMLMSASRVISLGKEVIVRAKDSVDISSSDKDVRVKAENNLQMLGGNSGTGGVLIESKSQGMMQNYTQLTGEKAQGSGIVLLSKGGSVNVLTQTIYMRTGVGQSAIQDSGDFVIDCANGNANLICYASAQVVFTKQGLALWHSPSGQEGVVIENSNVFTPSWSKITGPTVMNKDVVIVKGGSLGVSGNVYAQGFIACIGPMGCYKGFNGLGDTSQGRFAEDVRNNIAIYDAWSDTVNSFGQPYFDGYFVNFYWLPSMPGNTQLVSNEIGFSYRDESEQGAAYGYAEGQFFLLETRWQQLDRLGLVESSRNPWEENSVSYQGKELYPWPGKLNWVDREAFLKYGETDEFVLFGTDKAKSRQENQSTYEKPLFTAWGKGTGSADYKL